MTLTNKQLSQAAQEELLTPSEVAGIFKVDPKTVTRWANSGRLSTMRTLGGQRRYKRAEVQALRDASLVERTESESEPES